MSKDIFAPNGGYCVYYPSNLFRNARRFENWGIFGHVTRVDIDRSRASEKILWIINSDICAWKSSVLRREQFLEGSI